MDELKRIEWLLRIIVPEVQDKYRNLLRWFTTMQKECIRYMDLWQQEKRAAEDNILGSARMAEEMKRRYEGRFEEMRTACLMILQHEKSTEQIIKACQRMMNEVNERLETWERGEKPMMEGEADEETETAAEE